jgi:hypothetical protein
MADAVLAFTVSVGVLSVLVTLFGAVPAVAWCLSRGPLNGRQVFLGGVLLGNSPFALGVLVSILSGETDFGRGATVVAGAVRSLVLGSFFGLAGASAFWAIARPRFEAD